MAIVRCLLNIKVAKGWKIHQMDVINVFLHENLIKYVYMKLSQGYNTANKNMECGLKKSLYLLHQASRNWY